MDTSKLRFENQRGFGFMSLDEEQSMRANPALNDVWQTRLNWAQGKCHMMRTTVRTYARLTPSGVVWYAIMWRNDLARWEGRGIDPEDATRDCMFMLNRDYRMGNTN